MFDIGQRRVTVDEVTTEQKPKKKRKSKSKKEFFKMYFAKLNPQEALGTVG